MLQSFYFEYNIHGRYQHKYGCSIMEYPIISEIICTTSTEYASHWLQLEVLALPLQSRSRRELSHRLTGDIGRVKPTIIGGYLWKLGKLTNSVPDNVRSSIWRFWAYPQAKFIITSGLGILTKKKIEVMKKVVFLIMESKTEPQFPDFPQSTTTLKEAGSSSSMGWG